MQGNWSLNGMAHLVENPDQSVSMSVNSSSKYNSLARMWMVLPVIVEQYLTCVHSSGECLFRSINVNYYMRHDMWAILTGTCIQEPTQQEQLTSTIKLTLFTFSPWCSSDVKKNLENKLSCMQMNVTAQTEPSNFTVKMFFMRLFFRILTRSAK
jgi:hypothetical protein